MDNLLLRVDSLIIWSDLIPIEQFKVSKIIQLKVLGYKIQKLMVEDSDGNFELNKFFIIEDEHF